MIYLDNASTTRLSQRTAEACAQMMREDYFNPSALYFTGMRVRSRIEEARAVIADRLGTAADSVVFTSGATEANNWAVRYGYKNKKGNAVISAGEHPSVYETACALKNQGYEVRFAPMSSDGTVDKTAFAALTDERTSFVSVVHVSNETGAVNDIRSLVRIVREIAPRAVFHSDGVQAFGKIPVNITDLGVDLYSISAHKIGGPKGIGALVKNINMAPMLTGGGQERGLRSGTENTVGIIGFGAAAAENAVFDKAVFDYAKKFLSETEGVRINTPENCSGYIISASVKGIKSEVLQHMLSDEGILIGLGSACSSKKSGNRVLSAMGLNEKLIEGNIRLSFWADNTLDEIKAAMPRIACNIKKLRGNICG